MIVVLVVAVVVVVVVSMNKLRDLNLGMEVVGCN